MSSTLSSSSVVSYSASLIASSSSSSSAAAAAASHSYSFSAFILLLLFSSAVDKLIPVIQGTSSLKYESKYRFSFLNLQRVNKSAYPMKTLYKLTRTNKCYTTNPERYLPKKSKTHSRII